jgi:hypothetical protein
LISLDEIGFVLAKTMLEVREPVVFSHLKSSRQRRHRAGATPSSRRARLGICEPAGVPGVAGVECRPSTGSGTPWSDDLCSTHHFFSAALLAGLRRAAFAATVRSDALASPAECAAAASARRTPGCSPFVNSTTVSIEMMRRSRQRTQGVEPARARPPSAHRSPR